jgi:hypothetical protein
MLQIILQVSTDSGFASVQVVNQNDVDGLVGIHESSYTDFPAENGIRHLQDNQYDYYIASTMYHVEVMEIVDRHIHQCEAFFDDLDDPSSPSDKIMYTHVGEELQYWIDVKEKLKSYM